MTNAPRYVINRTLHTLQHPLCKWHHPQKNQ
jgi:hypothetical protein